MKKRLVRKNKTSWLPMNIVVLIAILACTQNWCPPGNGEVKKPFALAYVDTNWKLRIRSSDDGINWTSASGATPEIDSAPGIAPDASGVLYLAIFENAVSDAKFLTGLGPAVWDSSPFTVGDGHRNEIQSATSVVNIGGTKYLVAYNHNNQAKIVEFDHATSVRDFGAEWTPVIGVVNSNLVDRPALVLRNGRLIGSWLMANQLQMVTGDIQAGVPVWQAGYMFNANVTEQGFGSPIGAFALAEDGQTFYAAVVRQRDPLPGEQISHYFLFIYTSNNGLNWTRLTSRETMLPTAMAIAAGGTNDIITILSNQATATSPALAYRFNGSSWTVLNNSVIFGNNPINRGHDFTLFKKH